MYRACFKALKAMTGVLTLLATALVAAPAATQEPPREKVALLLNRTATGEHSLFYYGVQSGLYREEGIELAIQEGRGSNLTVEAVEKEAVTFGYADSIIAIRWMTQGAPVKLIGVLVQTSPIGLISLSERNIRQPRDLVGKKLVFEPRDAAEQVFTAFSRATGLKEGDLDIAEQDGTSQHAAFLAGKADLLAGSVNDVAILVEDETGKRVAFMRYADFGVNVLNNGIVVRNSHLIAKPDLVRRFMRASTRSAEAARANPAESVAALLAVNPKAGKAEGLRAGLEATLPLFHSPNAIGMRPFRVLAGDMSATVDLLVDHADLDRSARTRVNEFFTNGFLPP